jgi:predicted nucleic acid-binding protein
VRFWDSSALVALHVRQDATDSVRELYSRDSDVLAWVFSDVEMRSAVCRLTREGSISPETAQHAHARIESFWSSVDLVSVVDAVKARAKRLLGVHDLRAADALQLGAALVAALDEPIGKELVSLDTRLNEAARREGFTVLPE